MEKYQLKLRFLKLLVLLFITLGVNAEVPKEKMKEFKSVGAITSFDELCLKIYTDHAKANEWMNSYSHGENKSSSADPYRENPNDRVFLVGSQLAQFVVTFGEKNLCSIYGFGVDKDILNEYLVKLMNGYAASWETQFVKTNENKKGNMVETTYVANIPGTDDPILGIVAAYWDVEGEQNNLVKLSGVSLKRMQTSNKLKQQGPSAGTQ
jgi:hypothetical protein